MFAEPDKSRFWSIVKNTRLGKFPKLVLSINIDSIRHQTWMCWAPLWSGLIWHSPLPGLNAGRWIHVLHVHCGVRKFEDGFSVRLRTQDAEISLGFMNFIWSFTLPKSNCGTLNKSPCICLYISISELWSASTRYSICCYASEGGCMAKKSLSLGYQKVFIRWLCVTLCLYVSNI